MINLFWSRFTPALISFLDAIFAAPPAARSVSKSAPTRSIFIIIFKASDCEFGTSVSVSKPGNLHRTAQSRSAVDPGIGEPVEGVEQFPAA